MLTDHKNLIKDPVSRAIVNVDKTALTTYRQTRAALRAKANAIQNLMITVEELSAKLGCLEARILLVENIIQKGS